MLCRLVKRAFWSTQFSRALLGVMYGQRGQQWFTGLYAASIALGRTVN